MSTGRPKKTLFRLLKGASFKLGELQQSCDWGEVSNTGDKAVLAARIVEGAKNDETMTMLNYDDAVEQ
eukprot:632590-Rhodomonas_salina.2